MCGPGSRLFVAANDVELPPPIDWLPASGEVKAVSLNTLASQDPEDDALVNPNFPSDAPWRAVEGQTGVMDDWNGGAWIADYSALGGLAVFGGGHNGYFGNEVYVWDASTRMWSRACDPTYPWSLDYTEGELQPGEPMSVHTYCMVVPCSAAAGGGAKGSFILLCHISNHELNAGFTGRSHRFDFATGTWSRFSTNHLSGLDGPFQGTSCYDTLRDQYYYFTQDFAPMAVLSSSREWSLKSDGVGPYELGSACGYDETGDLVVVYDDFTGDLAGIDPATSTGAETALTMSGTAPPGAGQLEYILEKDAFYYWTVFEPLKIYKLTPPSGNKAARLAGTWAWSSQTLSYASGTSAIPTSSSVSAYSRWRYAPALRCFVVVTTITGAVYAFNHPDF